MSKASDFQDGEWISCYCVLLFLTRSAEECAFIYVITHSVYGSTCVVTHYVMVVTHTEGLERQKQYTCNIYLLVWVPCLAACRVDDCGSCVWLVSEERWVLNVDPNTDNQEVKVFLTYIPRARAP